MARVKLGRTTRFALALLMPFLALALHLALMPLLELRVWMLFYPAVFASARIDGRRGGLISTGVSAILATYFLLVPQLREGLTIPAAAFQVALFIAFGILLASLEGRLEDALAKVSATAERTQGMFQALVEQNLVGIYVVRGNRFQYVNARAAEIFGRAQDEIAGQLRPQDVVAPKERERTTQFLVDTARGALSSGGDRIEILRPDGNRRILEARARTLTLDGEPSLVGAVIDVTQAAESEELLQRREELLAMTSRMAKIGGWEFEAATGEGQWTPEVARIHDLDPATQPNVEMGFTFYAPEDRETIERAVEAAVASATPYDLELRLISDKGVRKWVRTTAVPVVEDGKVVRVEGTMQDITQRKEAELAQAASEKRYQQLFDSMTESVALCRAIFAEDHRLVDWVYLDVNPAYSKLTGFADVRGRRLSEVVPELRSTDPAAFETYERVVVTGQPESFDTFVPQLHGGRWIHVTATRPAPEHFFAIFTDITERKDAEDAREAGQKHYHQLFDSLIEGLAVCEMRFDEDDKPVDWLYLETNPAFTAITGLPDLTGQWVLDAIPGIDEANPELFEIYGRVTKTGIPETFETFVPSLPRHQWLHITVSRPESGRFMALFTDITERKEAEEALHELNTSLERRVELRTAEVTAANSELEAFAYAVSHDLRQPLRAMSGFARALEEDYGQALDETAASYIEHIVGGSRRMGELIDGILSLSRATRGALAREEVDVSALARDLLEELSAVSDERDVTWNVEPDITIDADPTMAEVLLRNLLGNAWKYTRHSQHAHISVTAENVSGEFWVCVADNGAGFDPDYADQLFKPFSRLHREDEFPGIGIGLATVQRIVDRHGGRIIAHGEAGRGARFCFMFPAESITPA